MRKAVEKGAVTMGSDASSRQRNEWMSFDEALGTVDDKAVDYDDRSDSPVREGKHDFGGAGEHDDYDDYGDADTGEASRVDDGGPPVFVEGRILLVFDVNGVLIYRAGAKNTGKLRPYLDELLDVLDEHSDRFAVAVWSSMAEWNLRPLVQSVFKHRMKNLMFIWDQRWCTQKTVKTMKKPLMRKDLIWVKKSRYGEFFPENTLLIDDAPIKCTENPKGTAVHPTEWVGDPSDKELRTLAAYLDKLGNSACRSSRKYVLENAYIPGKVPEAKRPASNSAELAAKRHRAEDSAPPRAPTTPPAMRRNTVAHSGWRRIESRSSPGVYYYFNDNTKESSVEPPSPWEKIESRSSPGVFYYWNAESKKSSVEEPEV